MPKIKIITPRQPPPPAEPVPVANNFDKPRPFHKPIRSGSVRPFTNRSR